MNASLTLVNAYSAVTQTFAMTSQDGTGSVRIDTATTNVAPTLLTVRHQLSSVKGGPQQDRSLLSVSKAELDSLGNPRAVVVNTTIQRPRSTAIDNNDILNAIGVIRALVNDVDFMTAVLRGER